MIVHCSYSYSDCLLFQSLGYSEGAGLTNGKVTPGSPDRSNSRRLSMENMQVGRRTKYLYKLILLHAFSGHLTCVEYARLSR